MNDNETLDLLNDVRNKYLNGNLLKTKNDVSNIKSIDVTKVSSNDLSEDNNYNIVKDPSVSERYKKSGTIYNESSDVKSIKIEDSNGKLNNSSKSNIVSVNYTNEKSEDNIVDSEISNNNNNNSISYKVEQDSEYEAVFSNVNDDFNDIVGKKKRKDEYFSKFNNI